jgi:microcystin-dependent protein
MRRNTHPTCVATQPAYPTPAGAVTGHFASSLTVPAASQATVVTAEWAQAVQEEIINTITFGGLSPSGSDFTQLRQAIQGLVTGAVPSLPSSKMDWFASTSGTPAGYLLADGSAVSRTTYSALFTAIGTTYGVGNGSTTFNLPPAASRTLVASGTGSGLSSRTVGQLVGNESEVLNQGHLPAHSHTFVGPENIVDVDRGISAGNSVWSIDTSESFTTSSIGSGNAHNNMQPSIVFRLFIKT